MVTSARTPARGRRADAEEPGADCLGSALYLAAWPAVLLWEAFVACRLWDWHAAAYCGYAAPAVPRAAGVLAAALVVRYAVAGGPRNPAPPAVRLMLDLAVPALALWAGYLYTLL